MTTHTLLRQRSDLWGPDTTSHSSLNMSMVLWHDIGLVGKQPKISLDRATVDDDDLVGSVHLYRVSG